MHAYGGKPSHSRPDLLIDMDPADDFVRGMFFLRHGCSLVLKNP